MRPMFCMVPVHLLLAIVPKRLDDQRPRKLISRGSRVLQLSRLLNCHSIPIMGLAKISMRILCQTPLRAKGCSKNCYIS